MARLLDHRYVKMNGLGNEILVLDLRDDPVDLSAAQVRALARPAAVPFDQAMVLYPARRPDTAAFVRIFNADGSQAAACGNGTRCIAAYEARRTGLSHMVFESEAGLLVCDHLAEGGVRVDMGAPRLSAREIPLAEDTVNTLGHVVPGHADLGPAAFVSMGNPHAIFFPSDDADPTVFDLDRLGPVLEHHGLFPERANISFARVLSPDHLRLDVWERGAGRTRACGTAACAAAVAAARTGRTGRAVRVSLPGGDLSIEWRDRDDHVLMTGPVVFEAEGRITPAMVSEVA